MIVATTTYYKQMSKEKEELIIRLLKEGKFFKEITQKAHVSRVIFSNLALINPTKKKYE
jgi:hypothetical protein